MAITSLMYLNVEERDYAGTIEGIVKVGSCLKMCLNNFIRY